MDTRMVKAGIQAKRMFWIGLLLALGLAGRVPGQTSPQWKVYTKGPGATFTTSGCGYSLSVDHAEFPIEGGAGQVTLVTGNGCAWSITGRPAWITLTSGSIGTGRATVTYTVAVNSTPHTRSATMTIGGQAYLVTQTGQCPLIATPASLIVPRAGNRMTLYVLSENCDCVWAADTAAGWIHITQVYSLGGNGIVQLRVDAATSSRSGSITIGSTSVTVNQQ